MKEPTERQRNGETRDALWRAVALILFLAFVQLVGTLAITRPWAWRTEMLMSVSWWILWVPLAPLVGLIARRFAFAKRHLASSVLAHASAATCLGLAHLLTVATLSWLVSGPTTATSTFVEFFARFVGIPFLIFEVASYAGVAAVMIASNYARAFRAEEVRAERLRAHANGLEASVVQAQLDALQMQLNPHFLFNSLNAVSGLIGSGRHDDAQEMLGRLGSLLRQTLHQGHTHLTTVAHEVELLRHFMFIETVRFGDRLTFAITVEDDVALCAIPSMLLQPLVENAVRHGIEPTLSPGTVSIDVRRHGADLLVRVNDSGRGLPVGDARFIREGIGLSNTRARLQQLFGNDATLLIENRVEGGATVAVRIPCLPSSSVSASA